MIQRTSVLNRFVLVALLGAPLAAAEPADSQLRNEAVGVTDVRPSNLTLHALELQSVTESQRGFVQLRGPVAVSPILASQSATAAEPTGYFGWYGIAKAASAAPATFSIQWPPASDGGQSSRIRIELGTPKFLLSPTQRMADGPPAVLPESVGFMKAYEMSEQSADEVSAADPLSQSGRKPILICIAAAMWHHDESQSVADPAQAYLVFENGPKSGVNTIAAAKPINTLDIFGFNKLSSDGSSRSIVGVHAAAN